MNIPELRGKIDQIDDSILSLLVQRMEFVEEIGKLKRESNAVIYHPDREKEIIDRLANQFTGKLKKEAIEAIFLEIFGVSRNLDLLDPTGKYSSINNIGSDGGLWSDDSVGYLTLNVTNSSSIISFFTEELTSVLSSNT